VHMRTSAALLFTKSSDAPLPEADTISLTRTKVEPMVRGLFPRAEQDVVLAAIEQSVVFVTSANIEKLLLGQVFDHSAWTLANLYLASLGAELLGKDAPHLVGLSEETTCFVSPEYFAEDDPFADFIVHEAAHIFHNCKRATIGLRETRTKEWLLDIEYRKRETFAYACEVLCACAPAREESCGTTSAGGGIRPRRANLRRTRGCRRSHQHRPGGRRCSERLEGHTREMCAEMPCRDWLWRRLKAPLRQEGCWQPTADSALQVSKRLRVGHERSVSQAIEPISSAHAV
jgi:hypothetical protein